MWTIAKRTIDKGQFVSKTVKLILRVLANHSERNIIWGNKYTTTTAVLFTGIMYRISFFFRKNIVWRVFSQTHFKDIFYSGFCPFICLVLFSSRSLKPGSHFPFFDFVLCRWINTVSFFTWFGKELKLILLSHLTANMWCIKQ